MEEKSDRRTQVRVQIPEGELYFKPEILFNIMNRYIGPKELIDVSKSGAGFLLSESVERDDTIKVKINIPGEKNLILHGQVKWICASEEQGTSKVGMQFSPFGKRRDYNPIHRLKQLRQLSEKYQ